MAKKKSEEKKEDKTSQKKTIKPKVSNEKIIVEKYSISELLEKNRIKPMRAVGFLNYYGLTEDFKKEFENKEIVRKFSEGEFKDMYERYIRRGI